MEFEFDTVGLTFNFKLENDILSISAEEGVKKWAVVIDKPMTFPAAKVELSPKDVFDLFRLYNLGMFLEFRPERDIFYDKIKMSVSLELLVGGDYERIVRCKGTHSITLERVGLPLPEQQVNARIEKLESLMTQMAESLKVLSSDYAEKADLLEFVNKFLVSASDNEFITFREISEPYCKWYSSKYGKNWGYIYSDLIKLFEKNNFKVTCGASGKCTEIPCRRNGYQEHRLYGYKMK